VNRLDVQLCIVGRGGGGREDLAAFNDEAVCRALAAVRVPTVSAVGHETDVTLADLVADVRAATPSAAAEAAAPHLADLLRTVKGLGNDLRDAALAQVESARERLSAAGVAVARAASHPVERRRLQIEGIAGKLNALRPLATLSRGYSVLMKEDGTAVTSVDALAPGDAFVARLQDGRIHARAERTETLGEETAE
jgi:exodeoxyribonuclease VII large subunit